MKATELWLCGNPKSRWFPFQILPYKPVWNASLQFWECHIDTESTHKLELSTEDVEMLFPGMSTLPLGDCVRVELGVPAKSPQKLLF